MQGEEKQKEQLMVCGKIFLFHVWFMSVVLICY